MTQLDDEVMTRLFRDAAGQAMQAGPLPEEQTAAIVAGAVRRRRDRTRVLAAGVATATVLAVVGAAQLPRVFDHEGAPPVDKTQLGTTYDSQSDWLGSLSRGADAQAAYVSNRTLHLGSEAVVITGPHLTDDSIIGLGSPVETGWLAQAVTLAQADGEQTHASMGVVSATGAYTPFFERSSTDLAGFNFSMLASPDGTQALLDQHVYDVRSGEAVARVPYPYPSVWSAQGIVLDSEEMPDDLNYLWVPGSEPVEAPAFTYDCGSDAELIRLLDGGSGPCNDLVLAYAPDDTLALVATNTTEEEQDVSGGTLQPGYTVLDVRTGESIALPPRIVVPGQRSGFVANEDSLSARWEDDDHVLVYATFDGDHPADQPVPDVDGAPREPAAELYSVILRCEISTQTCERASGTIVRTGWLQPDPFAPLD